MSDSELSTVARLRGLFEVTREIRVDKDLPALLSAIARTISETLGFRTVAINVYRPAWDDFSVAAVEGNEAARAALLGAARSQAEWEPLLDERFERRGTFLVGPNDVDWKQLGPCYVPPGEPSPVPNAWDPEDALFVPMRHTDGHVLGIISVDEPLSGMRPTDEDLDVLVAVADHAAIALQGAQEAAAALRHRRALEQLLAISSSLAEAPSTDMLFPSVCRGIRDALGFHDVSIDLVDPRTGLLTTRAAVGWTAEDASSRTELALEDVERLLQPAYEVEGTYLMPRGEAQRLLASVPITYSSRRNGRGPRAWQDHWLLVPLHDRAGDLIGVIWVDDPEDRLLPSRDLLQALRVFANQTTAAIRSAAQLEELRFLADHDPLTRLGNRRAFMSRLDAEVARSERYGRPFSLVLCDLDGFKILNDRYGHFVGDGALKMVARILEEALRRPDDAFRVGGDEFALVLAEADAAAATEVVSRTNALLAACDDERLVSIRASFGVASCPLHASDAEKLFRLADEALYAAKRGGLPIEFAA